MVDEVEDEKHTTFELYILHSSAPYAKRRSDAQLIKNRDKHCLKRKQTVASLHYLEVATSCEAQRYFHQVRVRWQPTYTLHTAHISPHHFRLSIALPKQSTVEIANSMNDKKGNVDLDQSSSQTQEHRNRDESVSSGQETHGSADYVCFDAANLPSDNIAALLMLLQLVQSSNSFPPEDQALFNQTNSSVSAIRTSSLVSSSRQSLTSILTSLLGAAANQNSQPMNPLSILFSQQPMQATVPNDQAATLLQQIALLTATTQPAVTRSPSMPASHQLALALAESQLPVSNSIFLQIQQQLQQLPSSSQPPPAGLPATTMPFSLAPLNVTSAALTSHIPFAAQAQAPSPGRVEIQVRKRRRYSHESFPLKLFRIIQESVDSGKTDIVSWWPDGKGFEIHQPQLFEDEIIPIYFRHNRMASFRRQLSMYGFRRGTSTRDAGRYAHELFHRDHPERCHQIKRLSEFKLVMTKEV